MTKEFAIQQLETMMEQTDAMNLSVRQEFGEVEPFQIVLAPVWKTRSGAIHNIWLFAAADEEEGIRIENITPFVAAALEIPFDPNTGGIKAAADWVSYQQVQKLSILLNYDLKKETI